MSTIINKLLRLVILSTLVLIPLGQMPGFFIDLAFQFPFTIHPLDIIALTTLPLTIFSIVRHRNKYMFLFANYILIAAFSLIISLFDRPGLFNSNAIFYLIRFVSFLSLSYVAILATGEKILKKTEILQGLLIGGVLIALFGWLQYTFLPDLRFMKILGWDDHYFRLTSTLLDPTFTGLILTFTALVALRNYQKKIFLFILITILFTYSRASYLSLGAGVIYMLLPKINLKSIAIGTISIFFLFFMLPKPSGEGGNLLRLSTITARGTNYSETIKIFKENPLLGVGFNNICNAKKQNNANLMSMNSCHGADNSYLFILATTGLVGGITFIFSTKTLLDTTRHDSNGRILKASLVSLGTHSFFGNSIFYMTTMAWLALLIGISRKN